jgi:P21-Rho-binding domain
MSKCFGRVQKRENISHGIRAASQSGFLMGLPNSCQEMLEERITSQEQKANPGAVGSAIDFYSGLGNATVRLSHSDENTDDVASGLEGTNLAKNDAKGPPIRQRDPTKKQVDLYIETSGNVRAPMRFCVSGDET